MRRSSQSELEYTLRKAAIGAAGGLAGLIAFRLYWKGVELLHGQDLRSMRNDEEGMQEQDVAEQLHRGRVEATEETVQTSEGRANPIQRERNSTIKRYGVHWSYPVIAGAAYGVIVDESPHANTLGLLGGLALWATVDEVIAPIAGTRSGRAERRLAQHTHRLLSHLVMGSVITLTTEALNNSISPKPLSRKQLVKNKATSLVDSVRSWLSF